MSEPIDPDDRDGDCEDVGVAFVSVRDIHNQRKDIIEQEMPREYRKCLVRDGRNYKSCNIILGAKC